MKRHYRNRNPSPLSFSGMWSGSSHSFIGENSSGGAAFSNLNNPNIWYLESLLKQWLLSPTFKLSAPSLWFNAQSFPVQFPVQSNVKKLKRFHILRPERCVCDPRDKKNVRDWRDRRITVCDCGKMDKNKNRICAMEKFIKKFCPRTEYFCTKYLQQVLRWRTTRECLKMTMVF